MMPMIRKLIAYAVYCGQAPRSALVSPSAPSASLPIGSRSKTSTVIATANTPSLNDSSRLLFTVAGSVRGRLRLGRPRGGGRLRPSYRPGQHLGHVDDLQGLLGLTRALLGADRVAEHDHAVRAAGGDRVRVGAERLVDPLGVDPLPDPLFHPHPGAARAAAEPAVLAPVHFLGLHARHLLHDLPRRREHLVVPAEEARVVIGDLL